MYQLIHLSDAIKRISDGAIIPADPNNRDYQDVLSWINAGNVPALADIPNVPVILTPSEQLLLANGENAARIEFTGTPLAEITFAVNAAADTLTLDSDGKNQIELTCDTPGVTIVVEVGTAQAVIYSVEAP
jgi:hypothetical protein